jgi:hypothetical protein
VRGPSPAFALVFFEGFRAAGGNIVKPTVYGSKRLGIKRWPIFVGGIAKIFKPYTSEFGLTIWQLVYEMVECFPCRHACPLPSHHKRFCPKEPGESPLEYCPNADGPLFAAQCGERIYP